MSYLQSKLDEIFSDPDAADLFAEFEAKYPRAKPVSPVERRFDEITDFFEKHGKEPASSSTDDEEVKLAYRLSAYRNDPGLKEKVRTLDTFGLLDVIPAELAKLYSAVSSALSQHQAVGAQIELLSALPMGKNHIAALNALCELVSAWQSQLSEDVAELNNTLQQAQSGENHPTADTDPAQDELPSEIHTSDNSVFDPQPLSHDIQIAPTAPDQQSDHGGDGDSTLNDSKDEAPSLSEIFADEAFSDFSDLGAPEMSDVSKLKGGWRRDDQDSAQRQPCENFEHFRARFEEIDAGLRQGTIVTSNNRSGILSDDDMFLWSGLIAIFSGEKMEDHKTQGMRRHVIFSNGTEGWLKETTIGRSMHDYTYMNKKAECKRLARVTSSVIPGSEQTDSDISGYLYVVRTTSDKEELSAYKDHIIKIGCTKNPVGTRLNNAANDATFLFSPADLLHSFELKGLDPMKVEQVIHAFFGSVRMNITLQDRFEKPVSVNEWFLLNPSLVEEALALILSGELNYHRFDQIAGKITKV